MTVSRPADDAPLVLIPGAKEEIGNLSPVERSNQVRDIVVMIPQVAESIQMLEGLVNATGGFNDPGGARICGESGTGKSVIREKFVRMHPEHRTPDGIVTPVVAVEMEQKHTAWSLLSTLLRHLGYPFSGGKNSFDLADILADGLIRRQVRLVLIDEAQESAEGTGRQRPREIANVLKRVYDKSGVALAFLGTPTGLDRFFLLGDQLATRISATIRLSPLTQGPEFLGILRCFDEAMLMPRRSDLDAPRTASAIHTSCAGNFRLLRKLLSRAVFLAATESAPSISLEHLRRAHWAVRGDAANPFGGDQ